MISPLVFLGVMVAGFYGVMFTYVVLHEQLHENIYNDYGIDVVKTEIDRIRLEGITYTYRDEVYEKCDSNCFLQQNMVDIIGYPIMVLLYGLFFITGLFFYYKLFLTKLMDLNYGNSNSM